MNERGSTSDTGIGDLLAAFEKWDDLRGGKTRNVDIAWFPKPITSLTDMREKIKVAHEEQTRRQLEEGVGYFIENETAEELARRGAFTRPGTSTEELIEEYEEETTPNKPHISSFRMQNRLFRFLGWTTRRVGYKNHYVVTDLGVQMTKFSGSFPSSLGALSEQELVIKSLLNFGVFNINDQIRQWDTRFKQRIVVNLLRVTSEFGYISNNELVVTAFALKDERNPDEVQAMIDRLHRLHKGETSISEAFTEVGVDPSSSSAVNNAYDGPKVLLSLCRQAGLLEFRSVPLDSTPFGDLKSVYQRMHRGPSSIKMPRVVNLISEMGRERLQLELSKSVIWFDELR